MPGIVRSPKHVERLVLRCAFVLGGFDVLLHVIQTVILLVR